MVNSTIYHKKTRKSYDCDRP